MIKRVLAAAVVAAAVLTPAAPAAAIDRVPANPYGCVAYYDYRMDPPWVRLTVGRSYPHGATYRWVTIRQFMTDNPEWEPARSWSPLVAFCTSRPLSHYLVWRRAVAARGSLAQR
jgi:hypothetical protein